MITDIKKINQELNSLLEHLSQRHSVCDLVDDKTPEEIEYLKNIWNSCQQITDRMEEIYKII